MSLYAFPDLILFIAKCVIRLTFFLNSLLNSLLLDRYIAIDMQLYLLAPLVVVPLFRRPRLGVRLCVGVIIVSMLASFVFAFQSEVMLWASNFKLLSINVLII